MIRTTTTTKRLFDRKDTDESSNKTIIFEIILIIISAIYSSKNKNANTIINKIKKTKPWLKVILYFLYFIFFISPFIYIVLIIINEKKRQKSMVHIKWTFLYNKKGEINEIGCL